MSHLRRTFDDCARLWMKSASLHDFPLLPFPPHTHVRVLCRYAPTCAYVILRIRIYVALGVVRSENKYRISAGLKMLDILAKLLYQVWPVNGRVAAKSRESRGPQLVYHCGCGRPRRASTDHMRPILQGRPLSQNSGDKSLRCSLNYLLTDLDDHHYHNIYCDWTQRKLSSS
jgi:hypothetical protein